MTRTTTDGRAFAISELQRLSALTYRLSREWADDYARYVLTMRNMAPGYEDSRAVLDENAVIFRALANEAAEHARALAFAARQLRDPFVQSEW